jgi:transposase
LQRWYRTLDHLIINQAKIEVALFQRLRDLFDFEPDLVFYDLTSTYFEGHGPAGLAKRGYSRDGKPRLVQVVVGVVMIAGWPIAHHVWAGNTRDSKTVAEVDAVAHYKELNEVERGFRSLKNPIGLRPIWHQNERRVRGHIFVAALAFLIERMLERALRDAGLPLSAQDALIALQTIRHVRFRSDGPACTGVTSGTARARQVLKALKITDTRPPTPRKGPATIL